jgi:hypothetical protein
MGVLLMNRRFFISGFSEIVFLAGFEKSSFASQMSTATKFNAEIDNPWLPLKPGTVRTYSGTKDDKPANLKVTVINRRKTVGGVDCVVVEELLSQAGKLTEKTVGYYAQDTDGNVWNFGEDVQELGSTGKVTKTEGWHAGIDGARPSLVMEAAPTPGHTLVNNYTKDYSEVVSLAKSVKVPFGAYEDALVVKEWTPDEPDILVNKYYVRDIGVVRDVAIKGDREEYVLVDLRK